MKRSHHIHPQECAQIVTTMDATPGIVRIPNARHMLHNWKGDGNLVPSSFNCSIFQRENGTLTITSNCPDELEQLTDRHNPWADPKGEIVQIDDAGIGCPVGGVLVGIWVPKQNLFDSVEVPVESVKDLTYQDKIVDAARALFVKHGVRPQSDHITVEICTGFCLTKLRQTLRDKGIKVLPSKITGILQDMLEKAHRKYLEDKYGLDSHVVTELYQDLYGWGMHAWKNNLVPKDQFKWNMDGKYSKSKSKAFTDADASEKSE